ncbi:MAG: DivIVA domain-containing protein [Bifidobacteriaceae bacterium]|jgi:DivIVA domain-containing protein|nr:DivIVA domain-containing protein [Bifidobacteriaceae bacterium]
MSLVFSKNKTSEFGYDKLAVDVFFNQVQNLYDTNINAIDVLKIINTTFPLVKIGYYTREVDLAVDKLVYAILQYRKDLAYESGQKDIWQKEYSRSVYDLEEVLNLDKGKLFSHGAKKQLSYKKRPVDKFAKKIKRYFFESGNKISVDDINKIAFPITKSGRGYDEKGVNIFLNRVKILLMVPADNY